MENFFHAEFEYADRRWKVINWDDTDGMWICQDKFGNIRYFSTEYLNQIFPKYGLTKPY